jgi:hypothetical protein
MNPIRRRRITLKADEDRNRCLYIYRFAVQKIRFVFVELLNCIKNRSPQQRRPRNNRGIKNIPILINLKRHNNGAYDASSVCNSSRIANINLADQQFFRNLRGNPNEVCRRNTGRGCLRLRKQTGDKNG